MRSIGSRERVPIASMPALTSEKSFRLPIRQSAFPLRHGLSRHGRGALLPSDRPLISALRGHVPAGPALNSPELGVLFPRY